MKNKINFIDAKYIYSFENIDHLDKWSYDNSFENIKSLVVVGRSNVGKSTFINAFFNLGISRVSKTPGRTQKINVFEFYSQNKETNKRSGPFYFFDLPGFGHAKVSKSMKKNWDVLMGHFFEKLNKNTIVLHIQDSRHPFMDHDLNFLEYANNFQLKHIICFNKFDKLKTQKLRNLFNKELKEKLSKINTENVQDHFTISALKKDNVHKIQKCVLDEWSI